ncbi:MAG TPA: hypothetical protein VIU63_08040 [Nitrospira sp.]
MVGSVRAHVALGLAWTIMVCAAVADAGPQQGLIEGEVVQVFPAVLVIRSEQGATVLQLTARTEVVGSFKPGDKVIAYVTPYGVSSVQLKSNAARIP